MINHDEWCTQIKYLEDTDILTRPNFDVNIRLLRCNSRYKTLIKLICEYVVFCAKTEKFGYAKPKGYSGANAGIPFNIIALANGRYMINPEIINWSGQTKSIKTNCGSVLLKTPVFVKRDMKIDVKYYDIDGKLMFWTDIGPNPGFTIQHEIQHTQGILIKNPSQRN